MTVTHDPYALMLRQFGAIQIAESNMAEVVNDYNLPSDVSAYVIKRAELLTVLNGLKDAPDLLSRRAIRSLRKFIQYDPSSIPLDQYQTLLISRLEKLRFVILLNPISWQPLQKPMLDKKWVWERSILEDYVTFGQPSPFHGEPINASEYKSLEALIGWVNWWVMDRVQMTNAVELKSPQTESEKLNRFYTYVSNASKAKLEEEYYLEKKMLKKRNMEVHVEKQALEVACNHRMSELVELIQVNHQESQECLNNLRSTLQANNDLLNSRLDRVEEDNRTLKETIEQQMSRINGLAKQVSNLIASNQGHLHHIGQLEQCLRSANKPRRGIHIRL